MLNSSRSLAPPVPGQLYALSELSKRDWMPRRNGKPISKFTILRWALHGKRGIKLRTLMVGGIRCCCDAWAMNFFHCLTDPQRNSNAPGPRDYEQAMRELKAAGVE
jgi:hypothetical protein